MENRCNIIRDILPLYIEDMVSPDTAAFVEEHLKECEACRTILESMKESNGLEEICTSSMKPLEDNAAPLMALKKKMRKRKILTIAISALSTAAVLFGVLFILVFHGVPANSDMLSMNTEFQYNDSAYLDQSFALHLSRLDGLPLNVSVKNIYETDEHGKKELIGYEITPLILQLNLGQDPGSYTIGYTYFGNSAPDDGFDFTITVKFKDRTVVYSMVEEGLFVAQDNVVRYGN